jgi:uncharacterized protein
MKIRSITCFTNPGFPPSPHILDQMGRFIDIARPAFEHAGYEVQTARLATVPFPILLGKEKLLELPALAQVFEVYAKEMGFSYVSLGPALVEEIEYYSFVPAAIAATRDVFFSGMMTSAVSGVSLPAVRACARIIDEAAKLSPDGFANLRFAALANVPGGSPFFPAAYHSNGPAAFALATEAADLAVEAFSQSYTLYEARHALVEKLEEHGRSLSEVAARLVEETGLTFGGIDFSLAPFPEQTRSLGYAMEYLGVPAVGLHGSLAAAAILAEAIDRAEFPHTGFSGLMLPVLEDAILASRAAEGVLSIKDLLLFSAVCGTGLDTVPLPGDVTIEQLYAILLDLAVLSERLKKPLTARLMPVPGKSAGDPTGFDFAFFANSRVMAVEASILSGFLAGDESFRLTQRGKAL